MRPRSNRLAAPCRKDIGNPPLDLRAPKPVAHISHALGRNGGSENGRQLLLCRRWEVRLKTSVNHRLSRNRGKGGLVSVFALKNIACRAMQVLWVVIGCFHGSFLLLTAPVG